MTNPVKASIEYQVDIDIVINQLSPKLKNKIYYRICFKNVDNSFSGSY
jgi:hypothetical protein